MKKILLLGLMLISIGIGVLSKSIGATIIALGVSLLYYNYCLWLDKFDD